MKKIVLMMVVVFGLLMMGCPLPVGSPTDAAVSSGASAFRRAIAQPSLGLADWEEARVLLLNPVTPDVENASEVFNAAVEEFKRAKESFNPNNPGISTAIISSSEFDEAKRKFKIARDEFRVKLGLDAIGGWATEIEKTMYAAIKPWLESTYDKDYLDVAERLLSFYESHDYDRDVFIETDEYEELRKEFEVKLMAFYHSHFLDVHSHHPESDIDNRNIISVNEKVLNYRKQKPSEFVLYFLRYSSGPQNVGIKDLIWGVEDYYNDYIVSTHGVSLTEFWSKPHQWIMVDQGYGVFMAVSDQYIPLGSDGRAELENIRRIEKEIAESGDAPPLLMSAFKINSLYYKMGQDHSSDSGWRMASPANWNLRYWSDFESSLKEEIEILKLNIEGKDTIREALDVMFPQ